MIVALQARGLASLGKRLQRAETER
jgi:hypothetical protein